MGNTFDVPNTDRPITVAHLSPSNTIEVIMLGSARVPLKTREQTFLTAILNTVNNPQEFFPASLVSAILCKCFQL